MKVIIQDKTEEMKKENAFIEEKQKELNIMLGEVSDSLQQAEKDLEAAKDKLTGEIKLFVAEVKSQKKGASKDFLEVIRIFSTLLFKQT